MLLVSESFLSDIFGDNSPGEGSILVEKSRQDRTDDIKLARYFRRKFGGNYIVLSDMAPHGVKVPDLLLTDRALFENKIASSLSSLDSQTKKALLQLDKDNLAKLRYGLNSRKLRHVLVIHIDSNISIDSDEIKRVVTHRIDRYKVKKKPYIDYIMIRKNGRIILLWRYKEAP